MKDKKISTGLVSTGRNQSPEPHSVPIAVERASTVLFPTYDQFTAKVRPFFYGRFGTRTHRAFEDSIASLEGAAQVMLAPSGLAAITHSLISFALPGSHLLVTDSAYDPVRNFCDHYLQPRGVSVEYYDPRIGAGISDLLRDNSCAVLAESPGSLTFEIQNIPAMAKGLDKRVPLLVDNTWGSGFYFRPLDMGADISIIAATKYIAGHADGLIGTIAVNDDQLADKINQALRLIGNNISADEVYLAHRGLRSMGARLAQHQETGLALARYLSDRDEVATLLHPGLPSHPDHVLWKRDFSGSCGLFAAIFHENRPNKLRAFFDRLTHFGMGYSWGGFESLAIPAWPEKIRTAVPWREKGQLVRFHGGLEHVDDLIDDLDNAFAAMAQAG